MSGKRRPILGRVRTIVLLTSAISLTLASVVGIYSMFAIRNAGGDALRNQLEINLYNSISDKASLADASFGQYADCVSGFAASIQDMYVHPEYYVSREVEPPKAENQGVMTMQRYLRDRSVTLDDVRGELRLLGNLEQSWRTVIAQNADIITTIYIGTESGLHIAYDASSELGVEEGSEESHFDYSDSKWYRMARDSGQVGFTDIYQDAYGRGMMISCYAPFYDGAGVFRGVVCMDMLLADIYQQIVNMDIGEGAVYLIDGSDNTVDPHNAGRLIHASDLIRDPLVSKTLADNASGIRISDEGVYYACAPVKSTGWMLCISVPESAVLRSVYETDRNIRTVIAIYVASFFVLIAVAALASQKFVRSLLEPLFALGRDVATISDGNLDYRAEIRSNDEIGDLASSFNDMAASLQRYIADLTHMTAEKERIGAELNVATQIQADMLPRIFPAFPERKEFDIYASMTPAKEVGGDFYDFFLIDDNHLGLVMADVSGKGVPAALFMVIAKTLIKNHAQTCGYSPAAALMKVNEQLCEGNEAELFVTVWLAILEISTGKGMAANAGHEHPVLRRADGKYELVEYRHSPAVATMEGLRFREHEFELRPGDSLFVYTDGVAEATNAHNELYGTQRMLDALNKDPTAVPAAILAAVKRSVDEFVGEAPQFDDITMLCLQYIGPDGPEKEGV